MNFDHVNKLSDYWRDELMPHVKNCIPVIDFGHYLSKMVEMPNCRWMRTEMHALPINYFVDPSKFAKKHIESCVSITGTPSPEDGAFNIVYQISPTLHVLARLYHWVDEADDKVQAYLMLTCAFRNPEEFLRFFDDNKPLRMTGNTQQRPVGFTGPHMGPDAREHFLKRLMQAGPHGLPEGKPEES